MVNVDLHEHARTLIALSGPESVPNTERSWLAAHLESCADCRQFAENSAETVRSLRALSVAAGASLVSATQMRVRQRALELQRRQERLWVIRVCCVAATIGAALTAAALWRGFEWIGQRVEISALVWGSCFAVFCLMPAILAGMLLLARGTYLADHNGSHPAG